MFQRVSGQVPNPGAHFMFIPLVAPLLGGGCPKPSIKIHAKLYSVREILKRQETGLDALPLRPLHRHGLVSSVISG